MLYFLIELSEGAGFDDKGVYCSVCVSPSSLCIGCIVGLNVYITSECCLSRTLIDSPEGNKPNRNCFLEMHAFDFYSRNQKQQKTNELAQRTSGVFDIREVIKVIPNVFNAVIWDMDLISVRT